MATVQTVIDQVKWQVDRQTGNRLLAADLIPVVNLAYKDAWDLIVAAYEDHCIKKGAEFALTGGSSSCTKQIADADFYKLRAVQKQNGTRWSDPLPTFEFGNWGTPDELSYRLAADTLYFEPFESCAGTYRYWYVYTQPDLTAVGDAIVDINRAVERYLVGAVAIMARERDEKDTAVLERLQEQMIERIAKRVAPHRNAGRPKQVADVRGAGRFRFMTRSGIPSP